MIPESLESLPNTLGQLARQIPVAGAAAARQGLDGLVDGRADQEFLVLTGLGFGARFQLRKVGGKIKVFWVRRRQTPTRVLMDVCVTMRAAPVPQLALPDEPDPDPVQAPRLAYRLVLPRFVHRVQDGPGTIAFAVGPDGRDLLQLAFAAPLLQSRIVYTRDGQADVVRRKGKTWPLAPFLALADAIRDWMVAGSGSGRRIPLRVEGRELDTEPERLVKLLIAAWRRVFVELEGWDSGARAGEISQWILDGWQLSGYRGDMALRVREDGQLAETDQDDPFLLRLVLDVERQRDGATATITLSPPDFLVSGSLRDAFLEELQGNAFDRVARALRWMGPPLVRRFLHDSAEDATFFRVQRKKRKDRNFAILRARVQDGVVLVMLDIEARVDASSKPPEVEVHSVKLLHAGDPSEGRIDRAATRFFLRLARHLARWYEVVD